MGVWVGLAPFYLDIDEMNVLTGRAWLILAWKDHRELRKRERERFNSIWFVRGSNKRHMVLSRRL